MVIFLLLFNNGTNARQSPSRFHLIWGKYSMSLISPKHGISLIFPAAYYTFCRYHFDIAKVFDGIPRYDPNEPPASLSAEGQRACLLGWQKLLDQQTQISFLWLDPNKNSSLFMYCRRRTQCDMARRDLLADLWHPAPKFMALDA